MALLSDRALPLQVSQEPERPEGELWRIQAQAGLSAAAIVAVDIFFHFFYILTIPSDLKFASRLPDSALGGSLQRKGGRAASWSAAMTQDPRAQGLELTLQTVGITFVSSLEAPSLPNHRGNLRGVADFHGSLGPGTQF